jgi:hypothetical protein
MPSTAAVPEPPAPTAPEPGEAAIGRQTMPCAGYQVRPPYEDGYDSQVWEAGDATY